jgi:hypothetical protein
MAGPFESPYSDEQRDAVTTAYLDHAIRPARRVSALARAGKLRHGDDELAPFTVGENTIRDWARHRRRQRAGELNGKLSALPPLDAVEAVRRRLLNAVDAELGHLERAQNKRKPLTDKQLVAMERIGRIAAQAAKIPAPTDAKPKSGQDNPIGKPRPTTGTAGARILAAHNARPDAVSTPADHDGAPILNEPSSTHERGTVSPAQRTYPNEEGAERSMPVSTPDQITSSSSTHPGTDPGSSIRAESGSLPGDAPSGGGAQ